MSAPESTTEATSTDAATSLPFRGGRAYSSTAARPLSAGERAVVGVLSLIQAGIFAWGYVLPWDKASGFVVGCSLLSLVHLSATAACAVPAVPSVWRLRAWAAASLSSALFLGWATWALTTSAWYLSRLYGGLGQGMGAVLLAVWGLVALITLPLLIWGLVRTRDVWLPSVGVRKPLLAAALLCSLAGSIATRYSLTASSDDIEGGAGSSETDDATTANAAWTNALARFAPLVKAANTTANTAPNTAANTAPNTTAPTAVSLNHKLRATCKTSIGSNAPPTVLAHYVGRDGKAKVGCLQADTTDALTAQLERWLTDEVGSGPVVLDRLTDVRQLGASPSWLEALSLRPGVDGVCLGQRCYAPWQLVAQSRFVTHSPLPFLGDLKFGASLDDLKRSLAGKEKTADDGTTTELVAFTSRSVVIDPEGAVTPVVRMHPGQRPLNAAEVSKAGAEFEAHILAAQQESGQFRYTLDPFTRAEENRELNLARQAGTVFALCDVGSASEQTTKAARLGLQLLIDHHLADGERWALAGSPKDRYVRLGESALPLVALLTCRSRVGSEFDPAIAALSRFVLSLQREDGSFATDYDWKRKKVVRFGEALYAPGQALLGLTLLDRLVAENPELTALGDSAVLTAAIQRGMDHVANQHWNVAIYPFFFVEENWNCLTARAALARQRNPAYERFCLDYVAFKSRLILMPESDVAPEFVGGFGFGNLIPPHNTGAAGFGEALAAAVAVQRARGEHTTENERVLSQLLGFLLRQQWTAATCAACTPLALGSMSEHTHSPITRIDFGQHAWAALANGAVALRLTASSS
jgi:hypothetical protein